MLTPDQINQVIEAIKERYVLTEKNFNMSDNREQKKYDFLENILTQVCVYYSVPREYLNKSGKGDKIKMRLIYYQLARELPEEPISYKLIGKTVGLDHATVHSALVKFPYRFKHEFEVKAEYLAIKEMVNKSLAL